MGWLPGQETQDLTDSTSVKNITRALLQAKGQGFCSSSHATETELRCSGLPVSTGTLIQTAEEVFIHSNLPISTMSPRQAGTRKKMKEEKLQ